MQKVHILTHRDLDGAASYLTVKWFNESPDIEISYTPISSPANIRDEITSWLANNSFKSYDRVYFLDLDTYVAKDLIDHKNVTIIDHHASHSNLIETEGKYENAKSVVVEYTSCCKLLYKLLSKLKSDVKLTPAQKLLIAICDDYDSYTLNIKYSKPLNWVFYGYNNSFPSFIERFDKGFDGFNTSEKSMIQIEHDKITRAINNLEIYSGTLGPFIVASSFASGGINEVHEYILQEYPDVDISIIIMASTNRVSWRKNEKCPIKLNDVAAKLCNGGGHEYAAGGVITELFTEFTKTLTYGI